MNEKIKAQITKIEVKDSKRGGTFKYIFFKAIDTGKSYRTCIASEFRNSYAWRNVKVGDVLDNLMIRGTLVDADSYFRTVSQPIDKPI